MSLRDRVRVLLFFTPWASIPLAVLGGWLVVLSPVIAFVPFGWLAVPVGLVLAAALALVLRPRYRVSVLDSSPLGVITWLQRRR
jgi:hypothetical protein